MKNFKSEKYIPVLKKCTNGKTEFCYTDDDKAKCLNDYFVYASNLEDSHTV